MKYTRLKLYALTGDYCLGVYTDNNTVEHIDCQHKNHNLIISRIQLPIFKMIGLFSYVPHTLTNISRDNHHLFDYEREMEGLFSMTTRTVIYYDVIILDEPADAPASTRVLVSPAEIHYGYPDRITGEMVIPAQYDNVCID